jgi:hypothetical protein
VTAIVVIGVCLLAACIGAVFGDVTVSTGSSPADTSRRPRLRRAADKANERAAMTKDERGWWPGTPRRR